MKKDLNPNEAKERSHKYYMAWKAKKAIKQETQEVIGKANEQVKAQRPCYREPTMEEAVAEWWRYFQ